MTLFDLSHPVRPGMPVYPGDPEVSVETALSIEADGVAVTQLKFGSHTGTHLDAPSHSLPSGRTVDQIDLEELDGTANVLSLRIADIKSVATKPIGLADLGPIPDELSKIVCIATGWDRYFDDPLREQHPYLDQNLVYELWQRGARVLGVDTLSPDPTSDESHEFPVHDFWLGNDGIIVENLNELLKLPPRVHISILPLNLQGLDGSPVRAVARQL